MTNNVHKARYGSIDKKEGRKTRQNNEIAGFPAFGKAPNRPEEREVSTERSGASHRRREPMKKILTLGVLLVALLCPLFPAQERHPRRVVENRADPLPLTDVRLTGGPLKRAQDMNGRYLLSLNTDRMAAFLRESAGLKAKAEGYGGWDGKDRQLTGHIAGHYLSGVSLLWAATGDRRFKERADALVDELKAVQEGQGDGYIGAQTDRENTPGKDLYKRLGAGEIRSGGFDLNGMWSPWYVQHKIFAGLRDAYRLTGNRKALEVEVRFAAWVEGILSKLKDEQVQRMLETEFGGMNEVLVDLYGDTGEKRWLSLADRFHHRAIVDPLSRGEDILQGKHGNTQIPKLLGSLVRYLYTGDEGEVRAARFFWDRVAFHHSFATGGNGRNEYFGAPDRLDEMTEGRTAETCNVYNMLKMARLLFALEPRIEYADFLERALFNHILGSMDPGNGETCYMVPVGRSVSREYQNMEESFTCCVGSGMESHALHGYGIYYTSKETLWVNLYAPSEGVWRARNLSFKVETDFPEGDEALFSVTEGRPQELTIAFRRPSWAGEGFSLKVNGVEQRDTGSPGSYVRIRRLWKRGDRVEIYLPKKLHLETLADNPERAAILWGPLVLAGDLGPENVRWPEEDERADPALRPKTPVLVADPGDLSRWILPVPGKPGSFRTHNAGRDLDVELVPFYRLHRRIYAAYWDLLTPERWKVRSAELIAAREEERRLQENTVVFVQPGQMQSERDFNQRGEETEPVQLKGRYGRRAKGWFSFDIPVEPSPLGLMVTYNRNERGNRTFTLSVDGVKIGEERMDRATPEEREEFFQREYSLPPELLAGKRRVTLRFQALPGGETGGVYGIRVLRKKGRDGSHE